MPAMLKEEIGETLNERAKEMGLGDDFVSKIADENSAEDEDQVLEFITGTGHPALADRKSTRLNSSHTVISYAVFRLKKKNKRKRWQSQ